MFLFLQELNHIMPEVLSAKPPNHGNRLNHWTWIRTLWCFPKFQIAGTRLFDLISIYEAVYYIMYSFFLNRYCCTYSKVLCIYIYIFYSMCYPVTESPLEREALREPVGAAKPPWLVEFRFPELFEPNGQIHQAYISIHEVSTWHSGAIEPLAPLYIYIAHKDMSYRYSTITSIYI